MSRTVLTMYFLVEGETEKLYLEWLAAQLTAAQNSYRLRFRIAVRSSPHSCIKRFHPPDDSRIYVLIDYESTDPAHETAFQRKLHDMRLTGNRTGMDFMLGYSNYAFELWLILHKMSFTKPVYDRHDYLSYINTAFHCRLRSMHNYKKESSIRFLLAKLSLNDVRDAIARARQIDTVCLRNDATLLSSSGYRYFRHDPSLSVNLVIEDVLRRAGLENFVPASSPDDILL